MDELQESVKLQPFYFQICLAVNCYLSLVECFKIKRTSSRNEDLFLADHMLLLLLLFRTLIYPEPLGPPRPVAGELYFILLLLLLTAIELSLGGSSPYTSTDKTNKNKYT